MPQANAFIEDQTKVYNLLVQWLEDFKSKFGGIQILFIYSLEHPESESIINRVNQALSLFKVVVGESQASVAIRVSEVCSPYLLSQQAREARRAQGSILEYGLDYHLNKFVTDVNKS